VFGLVWWLLPVGFDFLEGFGVVVDGFSDAAESCGDAHHGFGEGGDGATGGVLVGCGVGGDGFCDAAELLAQGIGDAFFLEGFEGFFEDFGRM